MKLSLTEMNGVPLIALLHFYTYDQVINIILLKLLNTVILNYKNYKNILIVIISKGTGKVINNIFTNVL